MVQPAATRQRPDPDEIARLVLRQFDLLPTKRKPMIRPNGVHEWVPLAGIVAHLGDGTLQCLSLGTGMKCLPASKLPLVHGFALHDWHAEVVAIRAFNRLLLDECRRLLSQPVEPSNLVVRCHTDDQKLNNEDYAQPMFMMREDIHLYMYCSEAPCGDASMELTMDSQLDSTPWLPRDQTELLPGREYFSRLGIVRRKPARRDAPISMSKSCSDKLALKQCTSLLSSVTSLVVMPTTAAYLRAMILPQDQICASAWTRAFSAEDGRMAGVKNILAGGYSYHALDVMGTREIFEFSKSATAQRGVGVGTASYGGATVWNCSGLEESTDGGIVRGIKGYHIKAASSISRQELWALAMQIAESAGENGVGLLGQFLVGTYAELKHSELLVFRKAIKEKVCREALVRWVRNSGDDEFTLASRAVVTKAPFARA